MNEDKREKKENTKFWLSIILPSLFLAICILIPSISFIVKNSDYDTIMSHTSEYYIGEVESRSSKDLLTQKYNYRIIIAYTGETIEYSTVELFSIGEEVIIEIIDGNTIYCYDNGDVVNMKRFEEEIKNVN